MSFWSRLRRTLQPDRHDQEIEDEIQFHLAMKERHGRDSAAEKARFGNKTLVQEQTHAAGVLEWLESILADARYGLRQIRKAPGLSAAVILSLALGVGANTAIFSIVDAALLRSLPVRDPQSLELITWATEKGWPEPICDGHTGNTDGSPVGRMEGSSSAPRLYRKLAKQQQAYQTLIGFSDIETAAVGAQGRPPEEATIQYVSVNYFDALGVPLRVGRSFSASDDQVGAEVKVVIGHRFWEKRFGRREDILDQVIRVDTVPVRIVGVAAPGFFGLQAGDWVDVYAPLAAHTVLDPREHSAQPREERDDYWWVRLMGRLQPGADAALSRQQLSALYRTLVVPDGLKMEPSKIPSLVGADGRRGFDVMEADSAKSLWMLLLLVALVLLIVCANVANLLLSRAVARRRESAVRLALGAPRSRLLRQQLIESLTFALAGGLLGLAISGPLAHGVHALVQSGTRNGGYDLRMNGVVLAYTAGLSILAALMAGIMPAIRSARTGLNDQLKTHGRSVLAGRLRLPRALVVSQIALCLVVLVAAGLIGRSVSNLRSQELGFQADNILYATVSPGRAGYPPEQVEQYVRRFQEKLEAIPGVLRVSTIRSRPLSGSSSMTQANIPGRPFREDRSDGVLLHHAGPGLFETLGMEMISGRPLEERDMLPKTSSAVVDELFVKRFFPGQNPLGQRFGTGRDSKHELEIVGVVRSSRYNSLRQDLRPIVYFPFRHAENHNARVNFVIRAAIDSRRLGKSIRDAAAAIDSQVPVHDLQTQSALIDHLLRRERTMSILSNCFGGIGLLLSAVGLAGLLSYAVARRRNEIGIRIALGATPAVVIRSILRDSLWLVAAGIAIGMPCAYLIGTMLKATLFGLQPTDPVTIGGALTVLAAVATFAAWIPARRAAGIDPLTALRDE